MSYKWLDLGPRANGQGSITYKTITLLLGMYWHGTLGGNREMITNGRWSIDIEPKKHGKPIKD